MSTAPQQPDGGAWSLLGLQTAAGATSADLAAASPTTPVAARRAQAWTVPHVLAAGAAPAPSTGESARAPPARVVGTPTARDRAYTFIMELSVTRVRQLCRDARLKQCGRKEESQPRLFWGMCEAAAQVDAETEAEKWATAVPGFADWLAQAHREESTSWLAAPPRSARPENFLSYYSHVYPNRSTPTSSANVAAAAALAQTTTPRGSPAAAARRTPPAPAQPPADATPPAPAVEPPLSFLSAAETPMLRDRAFTYVTSLPVTTLRQMCKRLQLKQFGRKFESQARVFWHWADVVAEDDPAALVSPDGEIDPLPGAEALPGLEEWLAAGPPAPGKWVRAPSNRPPASPGRRRESAGGRRKRFSLHELARLVAALTSTAGIREGYARAATDGGASARNFWVSVVEPVFNDPSFAPNVSVPGADAAILPVLGRSGAELRRHFDEARPLFSSTYRVWLGAGGHPREFDALLGEGGGGKLSAVERRASVLFQALRCGTDAEHSDVLAVVLRDVKPPRSRKSEQFVAPTAAAAFVGPPAAPTGPGAATVPALPPNVGTPAGAIGAGGYATRMGAVPIAPAGDFNPRVLDIMQSGFQEAAMQAAGMQDADPAMDVDGDGAGATGSAGGPAGASVPGGAAASVVAADAAAAAAGADDGEKMETSVLGKRARDVCGPTAAAVAKVAADVKTLAKRVEDIVTPMEKMQRQQLKMNRQKFVVEQIINLRKLQKELANETDDASARLRNSNAVALERLIAESMSHANV